MKTVISLLIVLLLAGAASHRNRAWHTLLAMWTDCAAKSPQKSRTHNNLGNCYSLLDQHFSAIAEYQRAVALDKGNMEAQYNLAVKLDSVGFSALAIQPYDMFCKFAPPTFPEQKRYACERLRELLRDATPSGGSPVARSR